MPSCEIPAHHETYVDIRGYLACIDHPIYNKELVEPLQGLYELSDEGVSEMYKSGNCLSSVIALLPKISATELRCGVSDAVKALAVVEIQNGREEVYKATVLFDKGAPSAQILTGCDKIGDNHHAMGNQFDRPSFQRAGLYFALDEAGSASRNAECVKY